MFQFSVLESCGIPRKEVRVVALSGIFFFDFPPLLFPAHSLFDKGGERDDGGTNKESPGVEVCGYECMSVCVCREHFGGSVLPSSAVSHHAIDPPGSFRCSSDFIILLSS